MQYILIGLFCYWFACLSKIPTYIAKGLYKLNVRKLVRVDGKAAYTLVSMFPLNCEKCLAFWAALIYSGMASDPFLISILMAGCTSLLAMTCAFIINKI